MQNDFQLTVGAMRRRLRSCYPNQEVVTLEGEGPVRASYAQVAERVDRLGRVLERLGVERGDRVATFAWNTQRHFELYLAVPSYGAQIDKAKGAFADNDPQAIVKAQADLVSAVTKVQAQINQTIADINKKLRE